MRFSTTTNGLRPSHVAQGPSIGAARRHSWAAGKVEVQTRCLLFRIGWATSPCSRNRVRGCLTLVRILVEAVLRLFLGGSLDAGDGTVAAGSQTGSSGRWHGAVARQRGWCSMAWRVRWARPSAAASSEQRAVSSEQHGGAGGGRGRAGAGGGSCALRATEQVMSGGGGRALSNVTDRLAFTAVM